VALHGLFWPCYAFFALKDVVFKALKDLKHVTWPLAALSKS